MKQYDLSNKNTMVAGIATVTTVALALFHCVTSKLNGFLKCSLIKIKIADAIQRGLNVEM